MAARLCALPERKGPVFRAMRPLAESQERHTPPGRGFGCGLCWPRSSTKTSSCPVQAASWRRSQLGWGRRGRAEQPGPRDSRRLPRTAQCAALQVTGPMRKSVFGSQWPLGLPALAAPTCAPTTAQPEGTRDSGPSGKRRQRARWCKEGVGLWRRRSRAWVGQPSIHSIQRRAQRPWNPGPGGLG